MPAYRDIWRFSGYVADSWARLKVLALVFTVLTGMLALLWVFLARHYGVFGTVVLIVGLVCLVIAAATGVGELRRRSATSQGRTPDGHPSTDSRVLVRYHESDNERVAVRFLFPEQPDPTGPVMLAAGHGRTVLWHIAVTTDVPEAISDLRFNLVFPASLMTSLESTSEHLLYSRHDLPDKLVVEDEGKGALCLSGSYDETIPAGSWTTVLPFKIGLSYAREIPVRVKLTSSAFGSAEYCAPITAEIEPIRGTSPAPEQKGIPISRRIARQMAETVEYGLTDPAPPTQWTFEVVAGPCELLAPDPHPRHQVYLRVKNEGATSRFSAQVTGVSGSVTEPATPWTIPWRESVKRDRTIHSGATELLALLELIPMGEDPQHGNFEPGLMVARNSVGDEIPMRIVADSLASLYVNELGLDLSVVNVESGERQRYHVGVGLENTATMPPRLRLVGPT